MFISEVFTRMKPVISFEVFPPKQSGEFDALKSTLTSIAALAPDFVSVTCGAGGAKNDTDRTRIIASALKNEYSVTPLAHMTCVATDRYSILASADALRAEGIENILALRGDEPAGLPRDLSRYYSYAVELISELAALGGFCIGAACYPEGHIDAPSLDDDIEHIYEKQQAGASFLVTQLFFENSLFFRYLDRIRARGITIPVTAGVMPILSRSAIERMIFMCGASLPSSIIKLLHKYENSPSDLRKAGIEHAVKQMEDLVSGGADGVHGYTMNRADIAGSMMGRLRP